MLLELTLKLCLAVVQNSGTSYKVQFKLIYFRDNSEFFFTSACVWRAFVSIKSSVNECLANSLDSSSYCKLLFDHNK